MHVWRANAVKKFIRGYKRIFSSPKAPQIFLPISNQFLQFSFSDFLHNIRYNLYNICIISQFINFKQHQLAPSRKIRISHLYHLYSSSLLSNQLSVVLFYYFIYFLSVACEILVPRPGIELRPMTVKSPGPDHWITWELPISCVIWVLLMNFAMLTHLKLSTFCSMKLFTTWPLILSSLSPLPHQHL